ncbi:MAG: transposase [Blautia wexlerae]
MPCDKSSGKKNFPVEKLKEIYNSRWGIESSFRKLKYTIGLSHYHSYKPDFIKQEIWAKLIAYNATELLVAHTVVVHGKRKYSYKVNFTLAAHICRIYLRLHTETDSINVMALLQKELVPIRCDRQFPRLKTAHFRKPKYLIYRVS